VNTKWHSLFLFLYSVNINNCIILAPFLIGFCLPSIWALDVAEDPSFTDIEVDAFDLQDEFFPPPAWTPRNVRWHVHDVYEPFAQKLLAQFDVVHVRLFLSMSKTQIGMLICNAMTLLS
jgi:hypothetical protein